MFTYLKQHARAVSLVSGGLLIALGLWTALGCSFKTIRPQPVSAPVAEQPQASTKEVTMEVTLNAANFEAEVLKSDKPVIVDFWATWCGPCRMLAPELEQLAAEKAGVVKVGKVNVDENAELCAKYGITSIPAIFVFKNGQITAQSVGYQRKAELEALLAK